MSREARDALAAFGHHADDCQYAFTVCTCGFTEALRVVFDLAKGALAERDDFQLRGYVMVEMPEEERVRAILADPRMEPCSVCPFRRYLHADGAAGHEFVEPDR